MKAEAKNPAVRADAESPCLKWVNAIKDRLRTQIRGRDEIIEYSLSTFLARGHLLLEGPPGTGKTSLAKAIALAIGGTFRRVQMTSDLLPSDIVGLLRLAPGKDDFEFRRGPIFANLLLADELNRTSPKTQSALLEAMAEGTATVDGTSHALPDPFFVVATQNPFEFHGVYPLTESQLDRFMLELYFSVPIRSDEVGIYESSLNVVPFARPGEARADARDPNPAEQAPVITLEEARTLRQEVHKVYVEPSVLEYATDLVRATRAHPDVAYGVSVRGGIQFIAACKALAFVRGRSFVTPREVLELSGPALGHRLFLAGGELDNRRKREIIREIREQIPVPK